MKKIMIIAIAALAAVTSFGGACGPQPTAVKDTGWVYKWKFTGKTTKPNAVKAAKATSPCFAAPQTCNVRVPTSLKIQGYTMMCSPGCGDTFGEVAEVSEVFWVTKPGKDSLSGGVTSELVHIIGSAAKQVEIAGTADFTGDEATYGFTYAGLGKYDKKNSRVSSAKGTFAGTALPCECLSSHWWNCDTLTLACDLNGETVVYGKWSVKLQKSASKKYAKGKWEASAPKWVQWKNLGE